MSTLLEARDNLLQQSRESLSGVPAVYQRVRFVFPTSFLQSWYELPTVKSIYQEKELEDLTGLWVFRNIGYQDPYAFWTRVMLKGKKEDTVDTLELNEPGNDKISNREKSEIMGLLFKMDRRRPNTQDFEAFTTFLQNARRISPLS